MAHKKGQGSTQNNRDSAGRRLGVKKYGGISTKDELNANLYIYELHTVSYAEWRNP